MKSNNKIERKKMTLREVQNWFEKSKKGDNFCYHVGFLAKDSDSGVELKKIANFFLGMSELRQINLVQKKISGVKEVTDHKTPIIYNYIAQRT
jgi:hypothetical protein